jgi:hypothetical protein
MYFDTPVQAISMLSATLTCGYALWRGGGPERLASSALLLDWYAAPLMENHGDLQHAQMAVFAMDGVVTLVLLLIALRTDRFWPLWVTAFQILELLMHLAMLIDHKVYGRAYFIGIEISSYLMLIALAIGTYLETPRQTEPPPRTLARP